MRKKKSCSGSVCRYPDGQDAWKDRPRVGLPGVGLRRQSIVLWGGRSVGKNRLVCVCVCLGERRKKKKTHVVNAQRSHVKVVHGDETLDAQYDVQDVPKPEECKHDKANNNERICPTCSTLVGWLWRTGEKRLLGQTRNVDRLIKVVRRKHDLIVDASCEECRKHDDKADHPKEKTLIPSTEIQQSSEYSRLKSLARMMVQRPLPTK